MNPDQIFTSQILKADPAVGHAGGETISFSDSYADAARPPLHSSLNHHDPHHASAEFKFGEISKPLFNKNISRYAVSKDELLVVHRNCRTSMVVPS